MQRIYAWWMTHPSLRNFGDELVPLLLKELTGKNIVYVDIHKSYLRRVMSFFYATIRKRDANIFSLSLFAKVLISIGSVANHSKRSCLVWGAGLGRTKDRPTGGIFYAVRGWNTYNELTNDGIKVPPVVGDPALLMPLIYKPKNKNQKFKVGIIPHYVNYKQIKAAVENTDVLVIDLLNRDPYTIIDEICSCEMTISSSLHGIIVSHAYGIPSVWMEAKEKLGGDGVKFLDYFSSIEMDSYKPFQLDYGKLNEVDYLCSQVNLHADSMPLSMVLSKLQYGLLNSFPYRLSDKYEVQKQLLKNE